MPQSQIPAEIFADYIVEKLRRTNPHIDLCVDESKYVKGGALVHIPQSGNSPDVVKNRSVFPAVALQRGDTMITYNLDVYSTDPVHVSWDETAEISYDKTDSVLNDHTTTLIESCGDNICYNWVHGLVKVGNAYNTVTIPATNIIRTSGEQEDVNPEDGQTLQRCALHYRDLQTAQAKANKAGVPKDRRYAMIESYMYQQLIDSFSANQMAAFQGTADLAKGVVGMFAGWKILERGLVVNFDENDVPLPPEQALSATDNIGCLCWHVESVTKAKGDIVPFQNENDALHYGDVMSSLLKHGGRCRRQDWKGLYAIVQCPDAPGAP